MTPIEAVGLFAAALGAGVLNSVAGGGQFLTFPMLIFTGVPAIQANATSSVAVWPGTVASTIGYRRELQQQRPPARADGGGQRRRGHPGGGGAAADAACDVRAVWCPGCSWRRRYC